MSRRAPTDFPFGSLTDDAGAGADPVLVEIVQGYAGQRGDGGRDRDRAHRAQPDDPRRPRLPRRHPRPAAAQAHRPVVLRAGAPGRPRLPDRRRCGRATCSSTTTSTAPRAASGTCPTCASPCRCSRDRAEVVAFVQAFGHHDDIGGAVPGSMPSARDQRVRGGADGPADPALGRRRAQPGGAGDHDPQLPDAGVAGRRPRRRVLGLPDGRAAARRAVRPVRRATTVEACFDAIIDRTTETFRREILVEDPGREWVWEDYAEHDGVDEPRLHTQRITLTRTAGRRPRRRTAGARLRRHRAAGQGPDQPLRRLRRRRLPQEVAGADPAQPRRHPGADGRARRQRGRRAADRDALPPARHAADAGVPGADERPHVRDPAAARRARRRGRQGGRRPDAGRPGDDPLHRRVRRGPRRAGRT